jgi:hypothetical protein
VLSPVQRDLMVTEVHAVLAVHVCTACYKLLPTSPMNGTTKSRIRF